MSTLGIVLIVILILVVFGGWHGVQNERWGPQIPGLLGIIVVVLLILVLMGRL